MDIIYNFFKYYVKLCLFFYHKKIKVVGIENIPKKEAVLFISNHPNALLDPILIATNNTRKLYFLSRASAFKNKLITRFLKSVHMIPVYRKRDGVDTLVKNKSTFSKSVELMHQHKTLYIAAEGSHNVQRRIRAFKKGFVFIILDTFKKYPEMDIKIVPVGVNYDTILGYPSSASICYAKPISAKKHYVENDIQQTTNNLLKVVKNSLESVSVHVDDVENYDTIIKKLNALNVDYLNPTETNKIIQNIDDYTVDTEKSSVKNKKNIVYYLFLLNSFIPLSIWRKIKKGITEIEFVSTFRFAIGVTLFPIYYLIISFLMNYFFGNTFAIAYFVFSILLGLLLTKTSKVYH